MPRRSLHRFRLALARSRHVRERARFVLREQFRLRGPHLYRLRGGQRVCLRHDGSDAFVLDEVLGGGAYRLSPQVVAALHGPGSAVRILDLGANVGLATLKLLAHFPRGSVVAYEPDPDNARVLARTVDANDLGGRVRIVEACAGTARGRVRFAASRGAVSHALSDGETVPGAVELPVRDVFEDLVEADLVKMDIEGAEWEILDDPRWPACGAAAMVLEFHARTPFDRPAEEVAADALRDAGYEVELRELRREGQAVAGVLWGWRETGIR